MLTHHKGLTFMHPRSRSLSLYVLQYMPTIGDMYTKDVECLGAPRHIEIDDTAGQVRSLFAPFFTPPSRVL